jgi:predicted nucleic acid-binding protein
MKVFIDTNLMVAAFYESHPHHNSARPVIERVREGKDEGFVAAHSLAEVYSVITRLPGDRQTPAAVAWQLISENIVNHFKIVSLSGKEYVEILSKGSREGIEGGKTYDLLLLAAARKSQCERVFTFNVRHFQSLAEDELKLKIVAP